MTITIATYNILADAYAFGDRYPATASDILAWAHRSERLVDRFRLLAADVLCLQEVEEDAYDEFETALHSSGYRGHFRKKSQGKPDGCATFVREEVFPIQESRFRQFDDTPGGDPSGHLALTVFLERGTTRLSVSNTHIKWDPPGTPLEQRYAHLQLQDWLRWRSSWSHEWPSVLCGDFNVIPTDEVLEGLARHGFIDAHPAPHRATCVANRRARKLDYVFHSSDLQCRPGPKSYEIEEQTTLPNAEEPSDHLPLLALIETDC